MKTGTSWLQRMLRQKWELTERRDGRKQMTCWCEAYRFPHRIGSGDCGYHITQELCDACDTGYCEFHGTDNFQEPSLSRAERNRDLTRRQQ